METKLPITTFLSAPHISGMELGAIADVIASNKIAPVFAYAADFEAALAKYLCIAANRVVALSSGTAALHIAYIMAGMNGKVLIAPTFTFVASIAPALHTGAKAVVLLDADMATLNVPLTAYIDAAKDYDVADVIICVVHNYGNADLATVMSLRALGYTVIEDAAEAFGGCSETLGAYAGTLGAFGILSFNGNKIITSGGGGALICPDFDMATKARVLATQGKTEGRQWHHTILGFNYVLPSLSAAFGTVQLSSLRARVAHRKHVFSLYHNALTERDGITMQQHNPESNYWLSCVFFSLDNFKLGTPQAVMSMLATNGIECRLLWCPLHDQPFLVDISNDIPTRFISAQKSNASCNADNLRATGLCLPSGYGIEDATINLIAYLILNHLDTCSSS